MLSILATPIGNLADISLRVIDTLKNADVVLCEDTRVTQKLLRAHNITAKRLMVYNDHTDSKTRQYIISLLQENKHVALVSDAGTPLISDPGYRLVVDARNEQMEITSLPGPSSVITALTLCGLPTDRFAFEGFLPSKQQARKKHLQVMQHYSGTLIYFERASRLIDSLSDMAMIFGATRHVSVMRELTKRYEETVSDTVEALITHYSTNGLPKGEVVIAVAGTLEEEWDESKTLAALRTALTEMKVKDAASYVAEISGWNKKELYRHALDIKDNG